MQHALQLFKFGARFYRGGNQDVENLLFHRAAGVLALNGFEIGERLGIVLEKALSLRGPEQNIFAEKLVTLSFVQPSECLRSVIIAVVVVAQRERGARTPNIARMFPGKIRKL